LIIPVWNDSVRLAGFAPGLLEAIRSSGLPVEVVVADDGSSEEEQARLKTLVEEWRGIYPALKLHHCASRSYKGGAIYTAWDVCPEATWLGFVDCDGAIHAESTLRLIRKAMAEGPHSGAVGVRHNSEETPLKRPLGRLISFYLFAGIVHRLTGIRYEDTQCGAKVIPGRGYREVAGLLRERGFIFDVELLLALEQRGYALQELRIPWTEIPAGKVHPVRDAWAMLIALLRIRKRMRAGHYAK